MRDAVTATTAGARYRVARPSGRVTAPGRMVAELAVVERADGAQVVRVDYRASDGDLRGTSLYRANGHALESLESRRWRPGASAMAAVPWGLGAALALWALGRGLRRVSDRTAMEALDDLGRTRRARLGADAQHLRR